jgi:hypothetical protein
MQEDIAVKIPKGVLLMRVNVSAGDRLQMNVFGLLQPFVLTHCFNIQYMLGPRVHKWRK